MKPLLDERLREPESFSFSDPTHPGANDQQNTPPTSSVPEDPAIPQMSSRTPPSDGVSVAASELAVVAQELAATDPTVINSSRFVTSEHTNALGTTTASDREEVLDLSEDVRRLIRLADQGDANAQVELGRMYCSGLGVEKDFRRAKEYLEQAEKQGNALAQNVLGWMYLKGNGVNEDLEQAKDYLEQAAGKGNTAAQLKLGQMYYTGQGVEQDFERAREIFEQAAKQGIALAQFALGRMYHMGQGVEQDIEQAKRFYEQAAKQGYAIAQVTLGWMYQEGQGVKQDFQLAKELYDQAAKEGNTDALNALGWMYQEGQGVKQDFQLAKELYDQAAKEGNTDALNALGWMYQHGQGVKIDLVRAKQLYEQAARQGHVEAQRNLGDMYYFGFGVEKNLALGISLQMIHGLQKNRKQLIYDSDDYTREFIANIPTGLQTFSVFKEVTSLVLNNVIVTHERLAELDQLIRHESPLTSISLDIFSEGGDPEQGEDSLTGIDIDTIAERMAESLRGYNTHLTELIFIDNSPADPIKLQIEQVLEQNRAIGELRQFLKAHPPEYPDELPVEVLMPLADNIIVESIRSGQPKDLTQTALVEFLLSVQAGNLQAITRQAS